MISQAQIVIGQNVTISASSLWIGRGDNPSDTAIVGTIIGVDGEWVNVLWPARTEPINYKSFDLDAA